ncbi:MAG: hypothetical protein M3Y50_18970 [Acidobacteriota bacterium]|nr:hypothetical protein [Acidobacteriota bacterium]
MPENIAQTVQKVIQDLVAPDVRELKVLVTALQKQIDQRFENTDSRFTALDQKMELQFRAQDQKMEAQFRAQDQKIEAQFRALDQKTDIQFKALMAALGEFKAQSELASIRVISALSERVAVLESNRH